MPPRSRKGVTFSKHFYTRSQAMKRLGLSLRNFRKLCILKGVFPRAPKKGNPNTVYYMAKDIKFISHDPLLASFEKERVYGRRVKRALGRGDYTELNSLLRQRPEISIAHVIRERYPSFVDALSDLDDAVSTAVLYSQLPAQGGDFPAPLLNSLRMVHLQFLNYVAMTHSLDKVFVSIKGMYYQAVVNGIEITWLEPHKVKLTQDSMGQLSVMQPFVAFYDKLLQFVLFKLYSNLEMAYPPAMSDTLMAADVGIDMFVTGDKAGDGDDGRASGSAGKKKGGKKKGKKRGKKGTPKTSSDMAARIESLRESIAANAEEDDARVGASAAGITAQGVDEDAVTLDEFQEDNETEEARKERLAARRTEEAKRLKKRLFKGLFVWLNRETPVESLHFVIKSFQGKASWGSHPTPEFVEGDAAVTHQVIDRPIPEDQLLEGRVYVQPQWVYDSVNAGFLLPVEWYAPGKALPPHLSPFEEYDEDDYIPEHALEVRKLKTELFASEETKAQEAAAAARAAQAQALSEGLIGEDDITKVYTEQLLAEQLGISYTEWNKMSQDEQDEALAKVADSAPTSAGSKRRRDADDDESDDAPPAKAAKPIKRRHDTDEKLKTIIMSKKQRKAYNRITGERQAKANRKKKLEKRAAAIKAKKTKAEQE